MENNNNLNSIKLEKDLGSSKNDEGMVYEKSTDDQIYELERVLDFRGNYDGGVIHNTFWDLHEHELITHEEFERQQYTQYSYAEVEKK